jgi:YHS domain-containing protein
MLRYLFLEIVLPLLVFAFLRSILRSIFPSGSARNTPRRQEAPAQPTVVAGGELKKDPVCGTYVSTALSVTRKVDGEMVHFRSKECRDKYRAA